MHPKDHIHYVVVCHSLQCKKDNDNRLGAFVLTTLTNSILCVRYPLVPIAISDLATVANLAVNNWHVARIGLATHNAMVKQGVSEVCYGETIWGAPPQKLVGLVDYVCGIWNPLWMYVFDTNVGTMQLNVEIVTGDVLYKLPPTVTSPIGLSTAALKTWV